jgi:hypothetical protein
MKFLYKYKNTLIDFVAFLKGQDVDPQKVLLHEDFEFVYGYIVSYLDTHGIYLIITDIRIYVYCDGTHHKATTYVVNNKKNYVIYEEDLKTDKPILLNMVKGVEEAFKFIEIPF